MKKNISTPVIGAIIAAVVILLSIVAWKVFGGQPDKLDAAQTAIHDAQKEKKE
jgi:hypothetical protein